MLNLRKVEIFPWSFASSSWNSLQFGPSNEVQAYSASSFSGMSIFAFLAIWTRLLANPSIEVDPPRTYWTFTNRFADTLWQSISTSNAKAICHLSISLVFRLGYLQSKELVLGNNCHNLQLNYNMIIDKDFFLNATLIFLHNSKCLRNCVHVSPPKKFHGWILWNNSRVFFKKCCKTWKADEVEGSR